MTDVVAALIWDGDRFLACQRPAHKARALLWEFVGGKREAGETPEQALIRECREELDITVCVGLRFMEVVHEYPDITIRLTLFLCTIAEGTPRALEHIDIRWIRTSEIDSMAFCPADKDILAILKTIDNQLQARLYALADPGYRDFQSRLIPTLPKERILGVRMPVLRKLAKDLACPDDLAALPHRYYEEDMLCGILLNRLKDPETAVSRLEEFLPHVDNWAVCDLLAPQAFRCRPAALLMHVQRWLSAKHPYTVRFGISVLMRFYLDDGFSAEQLEWVAQIPSGAYYVDMMAAWYFATALAKQYDTAVAWLEKRRLNPWVHRKTIQKAIESYRISPEQKNYLRSLREVNP